MIRSFRNIFTTNFVGNKKTIEKYNYFTSTTTKMTGTRFKNFNTIWRKESNQPNAFYINIEANGPNDSPNDNESIYALHEQLTIWSQKNNRQSLKYRNDGNKEFAKKNWSEAIRLYNQSLCFAEILTENVALAIANRSACCFNCGKYKECLVDIELATKDESFPQRLMAKLEKRKNDCLKRIQNGEQFERLEPKLDFEPNEKYPSMANVLDIKRDDTFGRYITAKEDIGVGKAVLIEKSYLCSASFYKEMRCNICSRSDTNLIACNQCTDVLFCVDECENQYLHKLECCVRSDSDDIVNVQFMQTVRSILIAVNTIPNAENLIEFVERTIAEDPMIIPECEPSDALSKYRVFLELSFPVQTETYYLFNARVYKIFKTLFKQPLVAEMFSSQRHQRFLKHLIAHHDAVIQYNCQSSYELGSNERKTNLLLLLSSYMNHSCAPNIATLSFNGFQMAIVVRPIKRGEQLFISYLGLDAWSLCLHNSLVRRQQYIQKMYKFKCSCARCIFESASDDEDAENSFDRDECYNYVIQNYHNKLASVFDREATKNLLEKCVEFMKKYGILQWTDEMSLQMLCYVHMLSLKYSV